MRSQIRNHVGVLSLLLCAGCGAGVTTAELVTARRAYTEARNGPAAQENPTAVHDAYKALQAAEKAHEDDAGGSRERHHAYIATRRAELAIAGAGETLAKKEQQRADATYEAGLVQKTERANAESTQYAQQLTQTAQELQQNAQVLKQREAELQAQQQQLSETQLAAQSARQELERLEALREEEGRLVISLSGGVLFEAGGHVLSDPAQGRLATVAKALGAYPDRPVTVVGHTDDRGSDAKNRELSQARAEAVRVYLERHGVPAERLRAVGRGESEPVASNDTTEGRANNRRVEIIVEGANTNSSPNGSQTGQQGSVTPGAAGGEQPPAGAPPAKKLPPNGARAPQSPEPH